jgi:hypothetical protein
MEFEVFKTMIGEIFGYNRFEILVFANPTGSW